MMTTESPISGELSADERKRIEDRWNVLPAMRYLGARVDLSDPALVRLVVDPVQPHHRGGLGTEAVNGVVMAGLFDLAIGLVAHFTALQQRVGTVQLNVQYMRPVHGSRFDVRGRLVRRGRTLVFATADLVDQEGTVCAKCDGMSRSSAMRPASRSRCNAHRGAPALSPVDVSPGRRTGAPR